VGNQQHHRRSIRLREHDYSRAGAYFVTICVRDRTCPLGTIDDGMCALSNVGHIVENAWQNLVISFAGTILDEYVIMPNHVHGIIIIADCSRGLINQTPAPVPTQWILMQNPKQTLGKMIRHFKAKSAKLIHDAGIHQFQWQRNYWERIIRNEHSLQAIREYIRTNPRHWSYDDESYDDENPHTPQ
jgi:REP element-mobilizing transposase RayT